MPQTQQNVAQTAAELARQNDMKMRNDAAQSVVSVPENYRLEDTEKYQPTRNRFRGRFETRSSADFAGYVTDRGTADKCFINNTAFQKLSCLAIFNLGNEEQAGHADDTAELNLMVADEFHALSNHKRTSQRAIVDFIQDYAHCLTFSDCDDDGEESEMTFSHALKAFRSVTVKTANEMTSSVNEMSSSKSAMERIEADSAIRLPRFVRMKTSLYDDLPKVEVVARVAVITDGDNVGFSLRIIGENKALNDAAERFVDMMKELLPDAVPVYVGTFAA